MANLHSKWGTSLARRSRPPVDTSELEALAAALNRSAERVQTLWFSFLTITLYFAIATGTTTHRMLLLEEGLSLPLVNLKLPLLGYYVMGPAVYVVMHAYFLMMLVLLARKAKSFQDVLEKTFPNENMREQFRMRIENALFLQIIIGALRERTGVNGVILSNIASISLLVAPVVLLIIFQAMFLPYHHEWIIWWHRGMIVIDLVLVWTLWPSYQRRWGDRLLPRWGHLKMPLKILLQAPSMGLKVFSTVYVLAFSLQSLTYPGEPFYYAVKNPLVELLNEMSGQRGKPLPEWLVYKTPFAHSLYLPNEDFVDDELLKRLAKDNTDGTINREAFVSPSFEGRDLTGADLSGTDMRQMNFGGAKITNADLSNAWLQGASFVRAELQTTNLSGAQMQGARFYQAQLQKANLDDAQLQGASLYEANLQDANLAGAGLEVAVLSEANLQGARLDYASLQGASLEYADMQGASFQHTQLQGASLAGAKLQGASLERTSVWRTLYRWKEPNLEAVEIEMLNHANTHDVGSEENFNKWKDRIHKSIPWWTGRNDTINWLGVLDPNAPSSKSKHRNSEAPNLIPGYSELTGNFWKKKYNDNMKDSRDSAKLADYLMDVACRADHAPYVARGIIQYRSYALSQNYRVALAESLKAGMFINDDGTNVPAIKSCPGAEGLTQDDIDMLYETIRSNYVGGDIPLRY